MSNPFQILGVDYDATEDQIKLAYRKLAMEHHPDRNQGSKEAEAKFKEVSEAYEKLKDPVTRQQEADKAQGRNPFHNGGRGFGFGFQGGNGHFQFDLDEIFAGIHPGMRQARPRNNDYSVSYSISLEDAFNGKDVSITIQTPSGPKHISTRIPPGIDNGQRIRLSGQGDSTHQFLPAGDIYVVVRVIEHERFQRVATNLLSETEISAFDALLGKEIDLTGIDGQALKLKVPPGTQPGQRFRIAGHGMPHLHGDHLRGDLIVQVHVKVPYLDDDKRAALAALLSEQSG